MEQRHDSHLSPVAIPSRRYDLLAMIGKRGRNGRGNQVFAQAREADAPSIPQSIESDARGEQTDDDVLSRQMNGG
ncbi:hypothetical protein C7U65_35650 [Bradyrhizobium sp. WBAH23]|nr:hypothetical protein [Bradyrhizobium sp. WBAH30]MDD1544177.1 hypothetical protein [Bradyrhizobium sp. WBAH41]MDD1560811.1 hypothetical protein [Bradyrhizobium sp. WBAH23]MDD1587465.1 hypothetical protein [Bradyrhizobium sp. WBAH42]NRB89135.1 hypothetical protein [Bradyrhizobium sp. WBAH10]QCJ94842.1 hypothetical protein DAA61_02320 [Bradyrhizobium sp. WBAH33]